VPSTMDSQVYIPVYAGGSEILLMHVDDAASSSTGMRPWQRVSSKRCVPAMAPT
jgi:hypothetical protein